MTIQVPLQNRDTDDLWLSVTDNVAGSQIASGVRVNTGQQFYILVAEDGEGRGNITWSVQQVANPERTAERTIEVSNISVVDLSTNFG